MDRSGRQVSKLNKIARKIKRQELLIYLLFLFNYVKIQILESKIYQSLFSYVPGMVSVVTDIVKIISDEFNDTK